MDAPERQSEQERYEKLFALFVQARSISDPAELDLFLDRACADDRALRHELLHLLEQGSNSPMPKALTDREIEQQRAGIESALSSHHARDGATTHKTGNDPPVIGRYCIIRRIASGGMGTVYEAEQDHPKRRVALKMVHAQRASAAMIERLQRESEILGRLQHPGIAQVYDAGMVDIGDGAQPYFAMEYIDGLSLTKYADVHKLDDRARLELLATICDAVHYAHSKGVVHRDLKPDNILVDSDGRPKILDFGVARITSDSTFDVTTMTREGQILGTLSYMAPEQMNHGPDSVTHHADIYALGVVGFELLTERLPHDVTGLSIAAALKVLLETDPPKLGTVDLHLRGDVQTIIGKALEREPQRRYESAAAMAADIRRYLAHQPINARPASNIYRARKFIRRNRVLVGGALATILALTAGLIGALFFAAGQRAERIRADTNTRAAEYRNAENTYSIIERDLEAGLLLNIRDPLDLIPQRTRGWEWHWLDAVAPLNMPGYGPFVADPPNYSVCDLCLWGPHGEKIELHPPEKDVRIFVSPADGAMFYFTTSGTFGAFDYRSDTWAPLFDVKRPDDYDPLQPPTSQMRASLSGITDERWPAHSQVVQQAYASADHTRIALQQIYELIVFDHNREYMRFSLDPAAPNPLDGRGNKGWNFVSISEDGSRLVACARDYTIHSTIQDVYLWDLDERKLLAHKHGSYCAKFRNGAPEIVMVDAAAAGALCVADSNTLETLRTYEIHTGGIADMQLSGDGQSIVTTSNDGFVKVTNADGGTLIYSVRHGDLHSYGPANLPISRDGTLINVMKPYAEPYVERDRRDIRGRLCRVGADVTKPSAELLGHTISDPKHDRGYIYGVAHSTDGSLIVSFAPSDTFIRLWDARSGEQVGKVSQPIILYSYMLAFTADDSALLTLGRNSNDSGACIRSWNLITGQETVLAQVPREKVDDLAPIFLEHLPNRRNLRPYQRLALSRDTGLLLRANSQGGKFNGTMNEAFLYHWPLISTEPPLLALGNARCVALHPDGKRGLIAGEHGFDVVNLADGQVLQHQYVDGDAVYGMEFSPDGTRLAVAREDGKVSLFESEFITPLFTFQAHSDKSHTTYAYVYDVSWNPDSKRLVTASGDGSLRVWDITPREERAALLQRDEELKQ